jgi:hypothetical protein
MISRPFRRLAAAAVLGTLAVGVSGCGGSNTLSDAATISFREPRGEETVHISRDALLTRVEQTNSNKLFRDLAKTAGYKPGDGGETTDVNLTAFWLSQMINQAVIDAEFANQHLQLTDADKQQGLQAAEAGFAKQQGDTSVFMAFPKKLQNELADARARLNAVLKSCGSGRLVSHILLRTKAQAQAAYVQIRNGAQFETVARQKSIDSGSAQQGGLLGCLAPGQFVPEFQKAAEEVPFDTVTVPVKTQFGYHLILVRRWDPKLAETNPQIAQALQQAAGAALDARVKALHVKVDPRFGSWGLHDGPQGQKVYNVTAPSEPTPRTQRESG